MVIERIISRSRPASPLIGRVWFNCNRVLTGSGIVIPAPPRLYFKNFVYYFILYFNINNNNNYNVF